MRRALVVGRSAGALEDYAAAKAFGPYDEVLVVGKMLSVFPDPVDHAVSFHSGLFPYWAAGRTLRGLTPAKCYWGATYKGKPMDGYAPAPGPLKRIEQVGGSSGFMAVQIAVNELGCERVVLAGMPMRSEDSHLPETLGPSDTPGSWWEADAYWETWLEHIDWLRPRVRSMSGRTLEALGAPTREWLEGAS